MFALKLVFATLTLKPSFSANALACGCQVKKREMVTSVKFQKPGIDPIAVYNKKYPVHLTI